MNRPVLMPMLLVLLMGVCLAAIGCESPETTRTRGGGPGADLGNRAPRVRMHEGSEPFYRTPDRIPTAQQPPLEPARQARDFSRS